MKIAVIYWNTLASYRAGICPELLEQYHSSMDVGHHMAYKTAVSVFSGESVWDEITVGEDSLDAVIILYGLSVYLDHIRKAEEAERCAE